MGGFGVIVVVKHPQKGQNAGLCSKLAQAGQGAYSYDAFGTACWKVYGASIPINPIVASVKEGAMITNINFNAWSAPAVASVETPDTGWATSLGYNGA